MTWNNYVYAAGGIVAVAYDTTSAATPPVTTTVMRYFHKDHLGSIGVITDGLGTVVQRLAYDAWGKRRNANGADEPLAQSIPSLLDQNAQTNRGFTGHEHLEELALVHMNGRIGACPRAGVAGPVGPAARPLPYGRSQRPGPGQPPVVQPLRLRAEQPAGLHGSEWVFQFRQHIQEHQALLPAAADPGAGHRGGRGVLGHGAIGTGFDRGLV